MIIQQSTRPGKRLMATFKNGKVVHFGLKGGNTYIDHGDKTKRLNYVKRHIIREDFNNPYTPGSLSRWLLWNTTSLNKNHELFMKRFPDI